MKQPKTKDEAIKLWDVLDKRIQWHVARSDTNGDLGLAEAYRKRCNKLKHEWQF